MYRMFDYCSYDNAIGSVGMTAKSLATFTCVQVSTSSGYITMPQAVAKLQPRRVILTFGTNDLNPGYKAADFVKRYRTGIEAIVTAYPSVDIIVNAIPPIGQQHSNQSPDPDPGGRVQQSARRNVPGEGLEVPEQRRCAEGFRHRLRQGRLCRDERRHPSDPHGDGRAVQLHPHHSYITEDDRPALTTIPKHTGDKGAMNSRCRGRPPRPPRRRPRPNRRRSPPTAPTCRHRVYGADATDPRGHGHTVPDARVTATPSPTPYIEEPTPTPEVTATPESHAVHRGTGPHPLR